MFGLQNSPSPHLLLFPLSLLRKCHHSPGSNKVMMTVYTYIVSSARRGCEELNHTGQSSGAIQNQEHQELTSLGKAWITKEVSSLSLLSLPYLFPLSLSLLSLPLTKGNCAKLGTLDTKTFRCKTSDLSFLVPAEGRLTCSGSSPGIGSRSLVHFMSSRRTVGQSSSPPRGSVSSQVKWRECIY